MLTATGFVRGLLLLAIGSQFMIPCAAQIAESLPATARVVLVVGDGEKGFRDGPSARFNKPIRLAPYGKGRVLVADIGNHAIRIVRRDGRVSTLAGRPDWKGHVDGEASKARLASPHGIAVSPSGRIAVAEAENHTIRIITQVHGKPGDPGRHYLMETLAGVPGKSGMLDGPVNKALFASPHAVIWLREGVLLVADIGNARLRMIENGKVTTVVGTGEHGSTDGEALSATLTYPMDLAAEPGGAILIADAGTHLIRRWTPGKGVETVSLNAKLRTPHGICLGPDGRIFVAELRAHAITARDSRGNLSRVLGTGRAGTGRTELNRPAAVLFHDGLLWIADLDNHQIKAVQLRGASR